MSTQSDWIVKCPKLVWALILAELPIEDAGRMLQVCKAFQAYLNETYLRLNFDYSMPNKKVRWIEAHGKLTHELTISFSSELRLPARLPNLRTLALVWVPVRGVVQRSLPLRFPQLRCLKLKGDEARLSNQMLVLLANTFSSLESLEVESTKEDPINDEGVRILFARHPKLKRLEIALAAISGAAISEKGSRLEHLSLRSDPITDRDIERITAAAPKLVTLNLWGCKRITNAAMPHIGTNLPELVELDLGHTMISDCRDLKNPRLSRLSINKTRLSPAEVFDAIPFLAEVVHQCKVIKRSVYSEGE